MKSRFLISSMLMYLMLSVNLRAQDLIVTGRVTDENGESLPGASVVEKGTANGTTTDLDGNYRLSISEAAVLTVSYVGYVSQEIATAGRILVDVQMQPDVSQLEEIVVVGYGTQDKGDLTGSVASYRLNENDGRQFTSAAALLQGRMPGVVVGNNSFQPGAAASIRIRGANSLRGDNEPLYVVDNVPMPAATLDAADGFGGTGGAYATVQSALASINPNDIASIEVLKDASATAIYGSRGANGVILITTKKGRAGKAKVGFESSLTIANISKKFDLLGLDEYVAFRNGLSTPGTEVYANRDTIPGAGGSGLAFIRNRTAYNASTRKDTLLRSMIPMDWQEELFQPAVQQNYRLTISGGLEKVQYFIAGGYQTVSGLTKGTGLNQADLAMNLNARASDKLKIEMNFNGVRRENDQQQNGNRFGASTTGSATRAALDGAPFRIVDDDDPDLSNSVLEEENVTSVFAWIEDYDDLATEYALRGGINLRYDIWNGISYELRVGGNYRWKQRSRWFGKRTFRGENDNGALAVSTLTAYTYTIENLLKYDKNINEDLSLNLLAGYTVDNQVILNERKNANGFDVDVLRTNGFHLAANNTTLSPIQGDFRISSYLSRANVSLFGGRYLITGSVRADGSSKFPADRWGVFPSAAAAWKVNEESFMSGIAGIDLLKLRVGWGVTGNQNIPPFSTLSNYVGGIQYSDDNDNPLVAVQVSNLANKELTWETTESSNLGVDFTLFGEKISGSVDMYKKTTRDLLNTKNLATSTGFGSIQVNQGTLENKGIELDLSAVVYKNEEWNISLGGNIAFNRAKIIDIGLEERGIFGSDTVKAFVGGLISGGIVLPHPANIFIEGREPGLLWGYKTDGILQEEDTDIKYSPAVGTNGPGEIKYVDINGDGTIDTRDVTVIGSPNPDFTYGFYTDFQYKGLSLRTFWNGVKGNNLINSGQFFLNYPAGDGARRNHLLEAYQNAWTPENPNTNFTKIDANAPNVLNDRYVEDAGYLRLAEVTLAYNLPSSIAQKAKLSDFNIFITARNLLTMTSYSGYDPAANSFAFDGLRQGIDFNAFPNVRSYMMGFKATF